MTKVEQKAASERIVAKLGPLTRFEARLMMKPDEYPKPGQELRVCVECGAEFSEIPATKERAAIPVLEQFSNHTASHNPSPAVWAEAYKRIEAGKLKMKGNT